CTETVEHFRRPRVEFDRFNQMLRSGGQLGIMTQMLDEWAEFDDWYYHYDITHICFYSPQTMHWIAKRYLWDCDFPRESVAIFTQTA
ncbi:MAG: methyltransferase domain-containing protein, partial [Armatimonadota bacterium]